MPTNFARPLSRPAASPAASPVWVLRALPGFSRVPRLPFKIDFQWSLSGPLVVRLVGGLGGRRGKRLPAGPLNSQFSAGLYVGRSSCRPRGAPIHVFFFK